jgi:hypothetical protein
VPTLALWIITGITTAVLLYSPCVWVDGGIV